MIKKNKKWYILSIMFFLCLVLIPYTLSKYSTTIRTTITLNARQPEYDVNFFPNYNNLPNEYTELEYIESTGTQYIDTKYKPTYNTGVEADFQFNKTSAQQRLFGVGSNTSTNNMLAYIFYIGDKKHWNYSYNNNKGNWADTNISADTKRHTLSFNVTNKKILIDNGDTYDGTVRGNASITSGYNLFVLANNGGGESGYYKASAKLFSFKIYEDGDLVRNYVPCYRNSDGVAGLYETINGIFYVNENTDDEDFTKGYVTQHFIYGTSQNLTKNTYTKEGYTFTGWNTQPDGSGTAYSDEQEVNKLTSIDGAKINLYAQWKANEYDIVFKRNGLPKGYQEVEYIESIKGQYIDTKYFATNNTRISVKFQMKKNNSSVFGARELNKNVYMLVDASLKDNKLYYYYGNYKNETTFAAAGEDINEATIYEATTENETATITNMDTITVSPTDDFSMKYSLYLFAFNESGEASFNESETKIYYFKIYESGILVKDYIPCYRISDGKTGLYDIVNDEFYTNDGTGTFNKGADTGDDGNVSIDGTMANQHFVYGTSQNLTKNTYTKEGYTFTGWNTQPDGSGTSYTDEQLVDKLASVDGAKINLYAQWEKEEEKAILEVGSDFNARIDDEVEEIIFTDVKAPTGVELTNVAADGSDSIVTWLDDTTMYISTQVTGKKIYANPDSSYLFSCYQYNNAEMVYTIDVSNLDTSLVTNMYYMFGESYNLGEIIGLNNFDTSNVTDMSDMFMENNALQSLDVSSFDTSNVTDMSYMFQGLNELTELDITNFDTSNVIDMTGMFEAMNSLEELDLSSFNTSKVTNMSDMFAYDSWLTTIYVSDTFVTTSVTDGGNNMFMANEPLVGGSGTAYNDNHKDIEYAHVDGGTSNPGYFTYRAYNI